MTQLITIELGDRSSRPFLVDLGRRTLAASLHPARTAKLVHATRNYLETIDESLSRSHCAARSPATRMHRFGFLLMLDADPDDVTGQPQAYVVYVAVQPEYRRRGVARRLLERAEQEARARGLAVMALAVTESNRKARTLYRTAGYLTERRLLIKDLRP